MDATELTIPDASKLPESDENEEIKDAGSGGSGDFFSGGDVNDCKEAERNIVGNSTLSPAYDDCQQNQKNFTKSLCDNSGSKFSKTNQPDIPTNAFLPNCSSPDKLRAIKQKYVQEGKRNDRKHTRSAGKSKSDIFVSKTGLTSSDAGCTKNILGIYGLKVDIPDVTKDVSDLPLAGLLDGSYKCPSPSNGKEKKNPAFYDIIHSVSKSYLQHQYNGCTVKEEGNDDPVCQPDCNSSPTHETDSENEDEVTEEILPLCKDSIGERLWSFQLYPPNVIMKLLDFSSLPDLDSLLKESSTNTSSSSHCTKLPPFSWSRSHNGPSKPYVDNNGKFVANRTNCQSKWVQTGGNPNFSAESDHKMHATEDGSKQQKIIDLLEEVKVLTMNHSLHFYKTVKEPLVVRNALENCNTLDNDMGLMDKKVADGNVKHPSDENTVINEETKVGVSHACTGNGSYFSHTHSDGLKHSLQQSSTWKCFDPEMFNAANILVEISMVTQLSKKSDLKGKNTAQHVRDSKIYLKSRKCGPSADQIFSPKDGPAFNVKSKKLSCKNFVGREQRRWLASSPKTNSSLAHRRNPYPSSSYKEMDSHPVCTQIIMVNNRHHVSKEGSVETTSYANAGKCDVRKEFNGGKRKML